jgi:hypothetical protein
MPHVTWMMDQCIQMVKQEENVGNNFTLLWFDSSCTCSVSYCTHTHTSVSQITAQTYFSLDYSWGWRPEIQHKTHYIYL